MAVHISKKDLMNTGYLTDIKIFILQRKEQKNGYAVYLIAKVKAVNLEEYVH